MLASEFLFSLNLLDLSLLGYVGPLLGYVGLGPGPEFIPYFAALLSVVGAALIAFLQWPVATLLAFIRGKRDRQNETDLQPGADSAIETQSDRDHSGS